MGCSSRLFLPTENHVSFLGAFCWQQIKHRASSAILSTTALLRCHEPKQVRISEAAVCQNPAESVNWVKQSPFETALPLACISSMAGFLYASASASPCLLGPGVQPRNPCQPSRLVWGLERPHLWTRRADAAQRGCDSGHALHMHLRGLRALSIDGLKGSTRRESGW